jgi:tryptophan synthase beta chain
MTKRILLAERDLPTAWYNLTADLPMPLPPLLNPATRQPLAPDDLRPIFCDALIEQEFSRRKWIDIPAEVREALAIWRPTPLVRATGLERALRTPARIYFKDESQSPPGSHKSNTAVAQAYYSKRAGAGRLVTETGGGQWGCSLAMACSMFGLRCKVFMVRLSFREKPYRRSMMRLWGADVAASPSPDTEAGRRILATDPNCPGSIGMAISESVETAATCDDTKYAIGSVLNHVLLHQTVIGLETQKQFELVSDRPDVVIGCVGGGSNFGGISFPFVPQRLAGRSIRFIAVEPTACPSVSGGQYRYDFADTTELTPLVKMYTLDHRYVPPAIRASGLRYHGMSPLVSLLAGQGIVEAQAYSQNESFEAAELFAGTEGIVPALETSYAVRAAVNEAVRCRETSQAKCILFAFSGHGLCELTAYEDHLRGRLEDIEGPRQARPEVVTRPEIEQAVGDRS